MNDVRELWDILVRRMRAAVSMTATVSIMSRRQRRYLCIIWQNVLARTLPGTTVALCSTVIKQLFFVPLTLREHPRILCDHAGVTSETPAQHCSNYLLYALTVTGATA